MYVSDATNVIKLDGSLGNENQFNNSNDIGIWIYNAQASLTFNHFTNNWISIFLSEASWADIRLNNIGFTDFGIYASSSTFRAKDNDIGITGGTGKYGILMSHNSDGNILENDIKATYRSVAVSYSDYHIDDCNVELAGGSLFSDAAISLYGSNGQVSDCYIDVNNGQAGIIINNSGGSDILHNDIEHLSNASSSSILCLSGSDYNIESNVIYGNLDKAIWAINSANNTIGCNDFESDNEAIHIDENAETQEVFENDLDGSNHDVLINSIIGVQEHHFNVFNGHVEAENLGFQAVEASKFKIDPLDSQPNSYSPSNFVEIESNTQNISPECSGEPGPRMRNLMRDTSFVCNTLQRVESEKDSLPKFYWINLYHLYKYYLLNLPSTEWPYCILQKWNAETECGIKSLLETEVDIYKTLFDSTLNHNKAMDSLSLLVYPAIDAGNWTSALSLLDEYKINKNVQDSLLGAKLASRYAVLDGLECSDSITSKWLETFLINIKWLQTDSLSNSDKTVLENNAALCSNEYGDVVQWSRELVSTHNTDRFFDTGCQSVTGRSRENSSTGIVVSKFDIYPNPVKEVVFIHKPQLTEYFTYSLMSIDGKLKLVENVSYDSTTQFSVAEYENGMYMLYIKDDKGNVQTEKFIIQK